MAEHLNVEFISERIRVMREKTHGYQHYRVLCDYVREAVAKKVVSFRRLGLKDEQELLELELECLQASVSDRQSSFIENSLEHALRAKLKSFKGIKPTQQEMENINQLLKAA